MDFRNQSGFCNLERVLSIWIMGVIGKIIQIMERAIRQSKKAGENNVQISGKLGVVVAAVATTATVESKLPPFNPNSE